MNILVTGANGQLGNEMRILAKDSQDKYIFTDVNQVEGLETTFLDITNLEAIRTMVKEQNVNAIVNCAAWTNVDGAEEPEKYELVEKLNATAPKNLAKAMKEVNGLLVHISTDYVFGAEPYNTPCKEDQQGTPTGVYGLTKLQYQIAQWGLETYNMAIQAVGNENPSLQYFHKRWRTPLPGLNLKAELTKKLHNARSDLSILIQETQDKQLAQTTYTNLWELTHPEIETKAKPMVDQGNYTQALEQAIKTLNGTILRENKPQYHPDSVLALLLTTNTATLTQEKTMRLLLIASEMIYRIENE